MWWRPETLPLMITPTLGAEPWAELLEPETWRLNRELGFTAAIVLPVYDGSMEELADAGTAGIVPIFIDMEEHNPTTHLRCDDATGRIHQAWITVQPVEYYDPAGRSPMIRHELGHVLGLDHDACPDYLMYYKWSSDRPTNAWFDALDLKALRQTYGDAPERKNDGIRDPEAGPDRP